MNVAIKPIVTPHPKQPVNINVLLLIFSTKNGTAIEAISVSKPSKNENKKGDKILLVFSFSVFCGSFSH